MSKSFAEICREAGTTEEEGRKAVQLLAVACQADTDGHVIALANNQGEVTRRLELKTRRARP